MLTVLRKAVQTDTSAHSTEEGCTDGHHCLLENTPNPITLEKGGAPGWILLLKFCCGHTEQQRRVASLLTSMELILIPKSSLLYLHSSDMNSLKMLRFQKKL